MSELQLCFSCQGRLNLAPVNKHHGGQMEMSGPSSGPTEDVTYHFNIFKIPNPGCLQHATDMLLWLHFLFGGRCRCRFWDGCGCMGRGRWGSHSIVQTETPATTNYMRSFKTILIFCLHDIKSAHYTKSRLLTGFWFSLQKLWPL